MEFSPLRIYELIQHYALTFNKSVLYYEIKYSNDQEKQEIIDFYQDKLPVDIVMSMTTDDDNFLTFENSLSAIQYAEDWFPYKCQADGMGIGDKFIFARVFDNQGNFCWDNSK
jgi:hypothetical protein